MDIIKLNAIDSTNTYLKNLNSNTNPKNFTVVVAENQTNGRGQMGANWNVESGKNLTFSVLVKDVIEEIQDVFTLNIITAVSIHQVILKYDIANLTIKWPNDILAEKKKIGGILIENILKNDTIVSIIGIGINVNQDSFKDLPQASSMKILLGKGLDKEELLLNIVNQLKKNVLNLRENTNFFWNYYFQYLFQKNTPAVFENQEGIRFMGIIRNVTKNGFLEVELEDDSIKSFYLKEIKQLY